MIFIAPWIRNLRSAAGIALIAVALAACASSAAPKQNAAATRDVPEHFLHDPQASPDVFAIQWAEIQSTEGYRRVDWHPLTGKDGSVVFVQQAPPRISAADIAATWVALCVAGGDDNDDPPKSAVVVQFQATAGPRLAQITRDRMNRFLAVLAEGKVVSFARVEWDFPGSLKLCLDAASKEQATSLARVLAGKSRS